MTRNAFKIKSERYLLKITSIENDPEDCDSNSGFASLLIVSFVVAAFPTDYC